MRNHRVHQHAGAALVLAVLSAPAFAQNVPDISGTYWGTRYNAKVELVGGGELPLTAKGKEAYEKIQKGLKDGSITDEPRRFCVPDGPVRTMANPYPFEIVQAPPGQVTLLFELSHMVRVIRMDKP